eukprot:8725473-Pyramimonas_sp.AAC.1
MPSGRSGPGSIQKLLDRASGGARIATVLTMLWPGGVSKTLWSETRRKVWVAGSSCSPGRTVGNRTPSERSSI